MAKGPTYRLSFRRRREGKTHYYRRKRMLLSQQPRLVIRKTGKHTIVQIARAKKKGDQILAAAHTNDLLQYGWKQSTSNLPAAYLAGLLAGFKAKKRGIKKAIIDLGLHQRSTQAKVFGALMGVREAGIKVNSDESLFPKPERVTGEHISSYAQDIAKKHPDKYKSQFSALRKRKSKPEDINKDFDLVKATINKNFGEKKS
jgi:large subunit ribosomal protein L18